MTGYRMNFNHDFTSLSVVSTNGFRLFSIQAKDKVEEIFTKENEQIRIVERLFNSSLVVLVTVQKPNCLRMLHFRKRQDICNCVYPSDILSVRMNRQCLIVCLAESIHIHDIRDMKILHSILNIATNHLGLCSLSLNSQLAYPTSSSRSGELSIFNVSKLSPGLTLRAHDTALSALNFSPNGLLLATASERGTVIRVFCVKNGQRVQEFRRGVKRCVRIASLVFSINGDFLCASSNTETVHIFKIDDKAVETTVQNPIVSDKTVASPQDGQKATSPEEPLSGIDASAPLTSSDSTWSGYISKAVSSYLIPTQVSEAFAQDRAFAIASLAKPGLKHTVGLTRIQKQLRLLIACEDGFLYIHDFNEEIGGICNLQRMHDLRYPLEGVVELNLTESMDRLLLNITPNLSPRIVTEKVTAVVDTKPTSTVSSTNADISGFSIIIENPEPDPKPDNSYAGIVKGDQGTCSLTDSAKFRKLCDAIDTPSKLYDEQQFPPVAIAAKD